MTTYSCPYCNATAKRSGPLFDSWKSVVMHTAHCTKNDHHWLITTAYGPIHSSQYIMLSTEQFRETYPHADRAQGIKKLREYGIVDHDFSMLEPLEDKRSACRQWLRDWIAQHKTVPRACECEQKQRSEIYRLFNSWSQFLECCGIETGIPSTHKLKPLYERPVREKHTPAQTLGARWNRINTSLALRQLYRKQGRIAVADCYGRDDVPSPRTINKLFGSWTQACEDSGLPTQHTSPGRGKPTYASDGRLYRSAFEAEFVDAFLAGKWAYEYEPAYPCGQWLYDFYVPQLELYIELDGGLRPARMAEKRKLNAALNRKFICIAYTKRFKQTQLEDFLI